MTCFDKHIIFIKDLNLQRSKDTIFLIGMSAGIIQISNKNITGKHSADI